MGVQYKINSKSYDLLDVLYFKDATASPRTGILEFIPGGKIKILEICVGTAANSIVIAENRPQAEITGIDLSQEMLSLAKEKIGQRGIKNINTLVMDATSMSFQDGCFDVILISLVLHEVGKDTRDKIMTEAKRVLKSSGKIIIVEWDQPKEFNRRFKFLLIKQFEPKGFKAFLRSDLKEYVKKFSLKAVAEKKCAYTRIFEVMKENLGSLEKEALSEAP